MPYLMHDKIRLELSRWLAPVLQGLGVEAQPEAIYPGFAGTPDSKMGQLAFAMFPWAKALKQNPAQLSNAVAAALQTSPSKPAWIQEARAVGPYVNFFYASGALAAELLPEILNDVCMWKLPKKLIVLVHSVACHHDDIWYVRFL